MKGPLKTWIYQCQEEGFGDNTTLLKKKGFLPRTSNLLAFHPYLEENGLMRVDCCISERDLPQENNNPVILPSKHPLTEKIVMAFHQRTGQFGVQFTLPLLRQHYAVIRARETVKKVIRKCLTCQKEVARPAQQLMGKLPTERLDFGTYPFTHTAVDYFGPLEVMNHRGRPVKRYGVLFTCLITRAVFLELAVSLSSRDFLEVFERFVGIYGVPVSMHSDNGTNFVGAEKELLGELDRLHPNISTKLAERNLTWKFQPSSAPHFGGAHESLVKSVKRALYKTIETESKHPNLRFLSHDGLTQTEQAVPWTS